MTYKTYMIKFERENGTIGADQFCATSSFGLYANLTKYMDIRPLGLAIKFCK